MGNPRKKIKVDHAQDNVDGPKRQSRVPLPDQILDLKKGANIKRASANAALDHPKCHSRMPVSESLSNNVGNNFAPAQGDADQSERHAPISPPVRPRHTLAGELRCGTVILHSWSSGWSSLSLDGWSSHSQRACSRGVDSGCWRGSTIAELAGGE